MKKNNLTKIRKKLDKLDEKLLDIIKKRILLVNEVLKNKQFKNQIIDRKRIREIHKTIRRKSIRKKIDTSLTKKIWKSMIQGFINYEYKNFKKK
ncbi:MAG: chorismate mutase [Pelagibacteraceae bacterium TMED247]|nr:chorismate mutase [Candidatus Pelagibacter sp.]RPG05776.1 MAG: chorismate mutase [Pelagibacteraceae bacterium TMED247]|tara:strand:+ start:11602 stop:11883 length:282 start_codon:yes stop_codon:yes gene_type:complete